MTASDKLENLRDALNALIAAEEAPEPENQSRRYMRGLAKDHLWLEVCERADDLFDGDIAACLDVIREELRLDVDGSPLDDDGFAVRVPGFDPNPALGRVA